MPNRRRAVDPTHPLGVFARQLRDLQAGAIARAGSSDAASEISIDKVAEEKKHWPTTRSAIYAALNGSRLPSPYTLCAIVTAWDPRGQNAIAEWLKVRDRVEEQLINLRPVRDISVTGLAVRTRLKGVAEGRVRAGRCCAWPAVSSGQGEVVHGGDGLYGMVEAVAS